MEFVFRPLVNWPGALKTRRKSSPFRAGYTDTLKLLDRELVHLKARHVVLQVALAEEEIRLDGRPRAGARPRHPGVILAFESVHGPLSYPCDTFDKWEDNLRAIALGLEHLRAVNRYGITSRGEQYRGWTALPAPPANGKMTRDEAVKFLQKYATDVIGSKEMANNVYRNAAFKLHPDRGGDAQEFKKLQEAKDALEL